MNSHLSIAPREGARPAPLDVTAGDGERAPRRVDLGEVRSVLDEGRFASAYEPIVQTRNGRTVAFEALARFRRRDGRAIAPAPVFSLLHADPALLLRAELTVKLHQVEHAPRSALFVNLDPDCWARAGDADRNPFLALFASARSRIVVEVTEALACGDAYRSLDMIGALRRRRLPVALDDVGAAGGLLSFDALSEVQVIKFDRTLLPRLRHPRCRALVVALTRMARETGAHTVLEGVETTAEFVVARDLGFDLVQGYLFRDRMRLAGR
ncbi:EAL domain-containing protein [Anaeromyxobacter oryzae]|uniref:Diguanylate phosphodiesterase n=1 Tax=Anaeromyxobacter oryzae TaxID=2918170 RepID=A0ABM7WY38_9BACT|nr:EAL domain-containing protein [Anaeromyxobacter oryzae]BDG04440.1 diguanylate phosphodiesterase [Anaeromyxobacter oryzae]